MSTGLKRPSFEHVEMQNTGEKSDLEMKSEAGASPIIDEAWLGQEKSLVRKLDMTLMPTIWVLYLFNYLDRNNIA